MVLVPVAVLLGFGQSLVGWYLTLLLIGVAKGLISGR